jgi:hypothetical protein
VKPFFASVLVASLTACGGGGGNTGTCNGSAQVCGTAAAAAPAPVVDAARVKSVACKDMASLAQALAYLAAGATQLDADNDGKPCEDEFPGQ